MVSFRDDPEEWQRLDWQILQNSAVALYFEPSVLRADISWFEAQRYRVLSFDARPYGSCEALLTALGGLLSFPEHFGRNLAAFNDCLSDVAVPDDGGLLLVMHHFDSFSATARREAQALLDICAHQSRRFLLIGRRFLLFAHSDDPRVDFEPVGATPVMWNPKEWLNSSRGL
jgi:RNAse (barnase) inhibitor barstar